MKVLLAGLVPILSLTTMAAVFDWNTIPQPPLPADQLELVTGDAQLVQDAQQRIAAIGILERARSLSNVRAQPYDLKTSFTAFGDDLRLEVGRSRISLPKAADTAGRLRGLIFQPLTFIRAPRPPRCTEISRAGFFRFA